MIFPLLKMTGLDYSIGVVTYVRRFEKFFQPLVESLEKYFPNVEKNYVLNGHYDAVAQVAYLARAKNFLKGTSASNVVAYAESQSLSRCWNQLILHSSAPKILILNDDIAVNFLFRPCLELQIWRHPFFTVNHSWSHFVIAKKIVEQAGWFDERFPANGHEDMDYALRLALVRGRKTMRGHTYPTVYCPGIKNFVALAEDPGWKKSSASVSGKTALANEEFFRQKWEITKQARPLSVKFQEAGYFSIRPGMNTPKFYEDDSLKYPLRSVL